MLNPLRTLSATHDKLMTARLLKDAGVPHPTTRHVTHPHTRRRSAVRRQAAVRQLGHRRPQVLRTGRVSEPASGCRRGDGRGQGAARPGTHPAARTRLADRRRLRPDRRCRPTGGGSRRVANERRARRRPEADIAPLQPGAGYSLHPPPSTPTWSASTSSPRPTGLGRDRGQRRGRVHGRLLARPVCSSQRPRPWPMPRSPRGASRSRSPSRFTTRIPILHQPCTQSRSWGEGSVKQWQSADRRGRRRHREGDGDAPRRCGVRPALGGERRAWPVSATSGRTSASST